MTTMSAAVAVAVVVVAPQRPCGSNFDRRGWIGVDYGPDCCSAITKVTEMASSMRQHAERRVEWAKAREKRRQSCWSTEKQKQQESGWTKQRVLVSETSVY